MSDPHARGDVSREYVDDLKRRYPIEEVAAFFTCLARAGQHLVGRCPLHEETTPSFYVFRKTRSWYCFGCQQGGDSIDLVRRRYDLPFDEALRWLDHLPEGSQLSGPIVGAAPHRGVDAAQALAARWSAVGQAALATALAVYGQALWETPTAQHYLARRGITEGLAMRCHLGYCSGHELIDTLHLRGIPTQIAWDVGLLVGTARSPHERFAGRIVIPEVREGTIAWMTGRLVESAEVPPPLAGPKYMCLPGARALGGATSLVGRHAVVVVEGPFDWLTLMKWDLSGCYVGGGGVPEETARLLAAAHTVYLAFDQDAAGHRMVHVLARHLTGRARFVCLPEGIKDVAELGRHADGLGRFRRCVRAATRHLPALATT